MRMKLRQILLILVIACVVVFLLTRYAWSAGQRQYAALLPALSSYERIRADGGWPIIPGSAEVEWNDDVRLPILQARLAAEGYLPAERPVEMTELRDAVRRFQSRNGLPADGRVGRKTLAALNLPVSFRVAQIRRNLDRWSALPAQLPSRYVLVNAAALTLTLVEENRPALTMRIVAGSERTPTPEFSASIQGLTVNPAWTIPQSIARKEILPKLKRDSGYLQASEMTVVGRETTDPYGFGIDWKSVSANKFPYVLRQRPGPRNPLGRIKFEMPNDFDVFLHDTPAKHLFQRDERWLSHGCIRLEQPMILAAALSGVAEGRLHELIAGEVTVSIPLGAPVPVHVGYWTAFVDQAGELHFRNDVYGRDGPSNFESVQYEKVAAAGCGNGQYLRADG
jgi:L,D-transpeptidase YcbB